MLCAAGDDDFKLVIVMLTDGDSENRICDVCVDSVNC